MKMLVRLIAAILPAVFCCWAALADPIADLSGFWSGNGTISLTNGRTERVKCQVYYKIEGSTQIRQTMRCASADYTINSLADLQLKGSQVTGSWEEKTYAAKGGVTGQYSGDSFTLSIKGLNFTAAMSVTLSSCKQSVNITPQGLEITRVAIALAKEPCGG